MSLTVEGCRLFEAVGAHFDGIGHALLRYSDFRHDALTLSASPGLMASWLMPRLPRMVAAYPELELNLQSSSELVDFEREPVGCALRYGRVEWAGLHADRLFAEWIAPVPVPELVARMGGASTDDLNDWPLQGDPNPADRWRDWFTRYGGKLPKRRVANFCSVDAARHAALEGLGVGLGRMVTLKSMVDAGRLVVLGKHFMPVPEAYWLVYPSRSQEHRGLQTFRAWLLAEAKAYREQMHVWEPDAALPAA